MKFTQWLKDVFGGTKNIDSNLTVTDNLHSIYKINWEKIALNTAINLISGLISKCEIKTFQNKKEVFKDEYYLWNIEPNLNQNSTQFLQELISRLLYSNECLVVEINGQLIIAEDFSIKEYVMYDSIFSDVSRGDYSFKQTFSMREVMYFKLNNENLRSYISDFYKHYNELFSNAFKKYEKNCGEKIFLKINTIARNRPTFKEDLENSLNNDFKKYFELQNAVYPCFEGWEPERVSNNESRTSNNEIGDIKSIKDQIFETTAQMFKIPPAVLKGDIADVDKVTDNLLTFAIDPLTNLISEEINRKRYGKQYLNGNFIQIDTTCIKHIDLFQNSTNIDKLISSGTYNIDEIRAKLGDTQLNNEWSKTHFITKNYTNINDLKGVEASDKSFQLGDKSETGIERN